MSPQEAAGDHVFDGRNDYVAQHVFGDVVQAAFFAEDLEDLAGAVRDGVREHLALKIADDATALRSKALALASKGTIFTVDERSIRLFVDEAAELTDHARDLLNPKKPGFARRVFSAMF